MRDYFVEYSNQVLFQILPGIKLLPRDSAMTVYVMNRNNSMQSFRTLESQHAGITALAPGDALNAVRMLVRPLSWSLTGTRRICRSSPMMEAYILSNVVEQGLQTRAVVFDMKGQSDVHQTTGLTALKQFIWDNHDVRDEEVNGPLSCYSPWGFTRLRRCQTTY